MSGSRRRLASAGLVFVIALGLSLAGTSANVRAVTPVLSPAQLAGQRVIYSYSGLTPPPSLLWLISHGQAAGVIFFGDNITGHAQIRAVIDKLEKADRSAANPVRAPLLLMTDQEGGQDASALGRTPALREADRRVGSTPQRRRQGGHRSGSQPAGVGMNLNLAPVLDVYRAAGDFDDQYGRSYSKDPALVAELGGDFIRAQQKTGVAATAKHFPGLGAATRSQNTDLEPVTLKLSLNSLRTIDELPYRTAIARGVRLVMVSWAAYPALDAKRPAGLSSPIISGELRKRLGFQGVTVTDALEAGALRPFGTIAHRSILAARAGMDLVLCSVGHVSEGEQARSALQQAYGDGTLNKGAFQASVQRIIALRLALGG